MYHYEYFSIFLSIVIFLLTKASGMHFYDEKRNGKSFAFFGVLNVIIKDAHQIEISETIATVKAVFCLRKTFFFFADD